MDRLVGKNVLVRTAVYHYTGKIEEIIKKPVKAMRLSSAAWIADTGRFTDALKSCDFNEVEPYLADVWVPLSIVADITEIVTLPTRQK